MSTKGSVAKRNNEKTSTLDDNDDDSDNRFIKKLRKTSNVSKKSIARK